MVVILRNFNKTKKNIITFLLNIYLSVLQDCLNQINNQSRIDLNKTKKQEI